MGRTLVDIGFDGGTVFNAAPTALALKTAGAAVTVRDDSAAVTLAATSRLQVGRDPALDALGAFTVEAVVSTDKFGSTQTLVESQTPPLRLEIDRTGILRGAVHTADGWQQVVADTPLTKQQESTVRLVRDDGGRLRIELDGKIVGEATATGTLSPTGRAGMSIGTDIAGKNGFVGTISGLRVLDEMVTTGTIRALTAKANKLRDRLVDLYKIDVSVYLDPATVDERFNGIKAIMRAAGVDDLSKLSKLTINQPTKLLPGTILRAPDSGGVTGVLDWALVAKQFATIAKTDVTGAARLMDTSLPTRRISTERMLELDPERMVINGSIRATTTASVSDAVSVTRTADEPITFDTTAISTTSIGGDIGAIRTSRTGRHLSDVTLTGRRTIERSLIERDVAEIRSDVVLHRSVPDVVAGLVDDISAIEGVERLNRDHPGAWPVMSMAPMMFTSTVLPVDSAVIIARRLDLTNQTLEIDPAVGTLYIIVEDFEASSGAKITWKRPVLDVPNIGPDPALNGHPNWSGVHTSGSKHGLPGGDAGNGAPGLAGRSGIDAPSVEIWALRANGMPDIDLAGQPGGQGGRGQQGGRGGRGADGEAGKWWWAFGKRCWEDPGNGGSGGRGGDGGRGGRAGDGGDGGNILFAVLEESLAALTTSNAFSPNLGAGNGGPGGAGGVRGEGGAGGSRGFTEVCSGGSAGAQGQPGQVGPTGTAGVAGNAGQMRIMTVTQESWDEQLTRPWLYDVTPNAALPGTTVILKGSRFADTDQVRIGTTVLASTLRADEGLNVTLPTSIAGGQHQLYTRRHDGQESNRLPIIIKPQITGSLPVVTPGVPATVDGRSFVTGAAVDYDGALYPATVASPTRLTFTVPETAGPVSAEHDVTLTVVNPDGQRSNTVTATVPQVLKNGFRLGVHDFAFPNDADGRPSWSTFETTFGAVEVWHELLDPVFGHPILTAAFYAFYKHFLDGTVNGGLATGFCTSLASDALDRFWSGRNDTFTAVTRDVEFRRHLTAIHGKLLSRESLIGFHDQSRRGQANVATTFRTIESNFRNGGTRETAPMLFFVPSGAAWDAGYFDMLASSHCIVPIRITYPPGSDGTASLDGIRMHCWDNNHPADPDCFVDFRVVGGETRFTYTAAGSTSFQSEDGITLATASLGEYLLRDHDLPFSGPLGLTRFVLDFLLSPATMSVVDDSGRVTGQVGGQILSEIPDSHPMYLVPNGYLLPTGVGMTRRITGTATGTYSYGSLGPDGTSIGLVDVPTASGEVDRVLANGDGTRIRFVPGNAKTVDLTLGRQVAGHARGVSVERFAATPTSDLDVTISPDLSLVRVANTGADTQVDVKLLDFRLSNSQRASLARPAIQLPADHDLVVAVTNWPSLSDSAVTTTVVAH